MKLLGFNLSKNKRVETPPETRSILSDDPLLIEYFTRTGLLTPSSTLSVTDSLSAMRLATVYRCISILSGTIAALPLQIRRKTRGYFAEDEQSELYPIFTWMASRQQTFYDMMELAIIDYLNYGNAYILIKRVGEEVRELVLCSAGSVAYDKNRNIYNVSDSQKGISGQFEPWQMIHLKNKSVDGGYTGVSTISYASTALSITANADNQTLSELRYGNKMKGFIVGGDVATGLGTYQDKQIDVVKDRLNQELASGQNIMRMPSGVDFKPISINPADAQLLETRKFSVFEICRFFGVHPDKVFAEQSSNYKASENSQISFLTDTLQPILSKIEAEFYAKLVPRPLVGKQKICYDLSALYQVDLQTKADYYKKMQEIGVYTTNEIRVKENLPPVKGGDVAFVSCNIAPIDSAKIRGEDSPPKEAEKEKPNPKTEDSEGKPKKEEEQGS